MVNTTQRTEAISVWHHYSLLEIVRSIEQGYRNYLGTSAEKLGYGGWQDIAAEKSD